MKVPDANNEEIVLPESYKCPLCGGHSTQSKYPKAVLPIRECICGMVFLMPQPTTMKLAEMYEEYYYASWGTEGGEYALPATMKKRTFAARLEKLPLTLTTGRVLDVGCATGFFLEVARAANWEVHGVELSSFAAKVAQQKFGECIFNGTLEQARYPDGYFDFVTLSDLIEHIPDPHGFLVEVRRILKPGGYVMVTTPNVQSLSAFLMGRLWSHYNAEHLLYFTPHTLRTLLERHGFVTRHIGPAAKYLNMAYVAHQFSTYRHPLLTPVTRLLHALLPERLKHMNFPIFCGEMIGLFILPRHPFSSDVPESPHN